MSDNNYIRNLNVPYFNQRNNSYIWECIIKEDVKDPKGNITSTKEIKYGPNHLNLETCNITCLAMVLNYLGVTNDTPDQIMKKIFEPSSNDLLNPKLAEIKERTYKEFGYKEIQKGEFLKEIAEILYDTTGEYGAGKKNLDYVKKEIANGYPVIVSCGITREYEEAHYKDLSIKKAKDEYKKQYKTDYDSDLKKIDNKLKESENLLKESEKNNNSLIIGSETKNIENYKKAKEALEKEFENKKAYVLKEYIDDKRYSGHLIVIRGFTKNGGVIINDPWGNPVNKDGNILASGKGDYSYSPIGDNIILSEKDFKKQYGTTFYQSLVLHHDRWNFILGRKKYPVIDDKCYEVETYEYGGYPMKRSNLWHNGIHIKKIGDDIYPIGPGMIVAARIKNSSDKKNDPAPVNGSRCFILVKHQILVNEKIEDFYSLYMHLNPFDKLAEIMEKYPEKNTEIRWIDDLLFRSKQIAKIRDYDKVDIKKCDGNDSDKSIGSFISGELFTYTNIENNKIYYHHKDENSNKIIKCWSEFNSKIVLYNSSSAKESMKKYKEVLEKLVDGEIAYFSELPDSCIEVTGGVPIGRFGEFGGYDSNKKQPMMHFEIFSDKVIIPEYEEKGFSVIKISEIPKGLCDREEMIKMFENKKIYGKDYLFKFLYLKEDGVITKEEMVKYYNHEDSKILRKCICQHTSEWWDKIDWEKEYNEASGVPNKEFSLFLSKDEKLSNDLKNYVKYVWEPYKWFSKDCIKAMNPQSKSNFDKGAATFYHPIEILKWLSENDAKNINKIK